MAETQATIKAALLAIYNSAKASAMTEDTFADQMATAIFNAIAGGLVYKGVWNCSGGTYPTGPATGDFYICSVAGTISAVVYTVGDWLLYNGSVWQKVDQNEPYVHPNHTGDVTSVADGATTIANKVTMTATSPIAVSGTPTVIAGGAVAITHVDTAGNKHVPSGGSSNQILKNSGTSGTGSWGTVTESSGTLGMVTAITDGGADITIENNTSDKDTIFKVNDGGVDTEVARINGDVSKFQIGVTAPTANGGILEISNGITFPAAQSACSDANTLDDYEEGITGAATFVPDSSGTITLNATNNKFKYIKIGRMVTVTGYFTVDSVSSPVGHLTITGLPFVIYNNVANYSAAAINYGGLNSLAANSILMCSGLLNTSTLGVYLNTAGEFLSATAANSCRAGSSFIISFTYFTE